MSETKFRSAIKSTLLGMASVAAMVAAAPQAVAQGAAATQNVELAEQPLGDALIKLSRQFGVTVLADERLVQGRTAPALSGRQSLESALDALLAGTGLKVDSSQPGTLVVEEAIVDINAPRAKGRATDLTSEPLISDRIVVTGTNIRGLVPESTPLRIIGRQEIDASGAGSTRDFIRTLPQNFGGGADDSFPFNLPGDASVGDDFSQGTSVNLRGLGAGSTLTLLNGRRLAPSSNIGAFTDISMIPLSAIERIEILSDGASAIYGSDAVGGVANFVLRDDYEGIEATGRYGTVTDGGLDEYRANITAGTTWGSGNGLITYEYYQRDNLDVSERAFSSSVPSATDLIPRQERHSVLASVSQSLTSDLQIGVDLLYSERDFRALGFQNDQVTPRVDQSNTETFTIGGEVEWDMSENYSLRVLGTYSTLKTIAGSSTTAARDNSADTTAVDAILNGSVLELPGGPIRFAVGGQYRRETFVNLDGPDRNLFADGTRNVYALFGELFVPVIGPDMTIPGVRRLEVNISGRFEDYSDFGSSTDPKVGLLYSPIEGLRLRGTYSTSFRPPALGRTGATDRETRFFSTALINSLFDIMPSDPSVADVPVLELIGTGSGLGAERSESWTFGVDYDATWGTRELSFSTSYFDTVFSDRINTPPIPGGFSLAAVNEFARNPDVFVEGTVTPNPTQEQIDAVLAQSNFPVAIIGLDFGPDQAQFLVNNTTVNVSRTVVRGIDFDVRYNQPIGPGEITAGLNATYLLDFAQQGAPTVPEIELLDTLYNPLDFRLRGQLGYQVGGFTGNIFVNYADGYQTSTTEDGRPIGSYTTVDLSLKYTIQDLVQPRFLNGTTLRFFVQNLLNEAPPEISENPISVVTALDPANASALQRFIAFEVTKAF